MPRPVRGGHSCPPPLTLIIRALQSLRSQTSLSEFCSKQKLQVKSGGQEFPPPTRQWSGLPPFQTQQFFAQRSQFGRRAVLLFPLPRIAGKSKPLWRLHLAP